MLVPDQLREAASAIGAPRSFVIRSIAYKAARTGIVTGILLAVARISGETAPLLFTALGNDNLRFSIFGELESLPTSINKFAGSAYPDLNSLAWTGALIVTAAVLILSIIGPHADRRQKDLALTSRTPFAPFICPATDTPNNE